jgi:hypothetical protein
VLLSAWPFNLHAVWDMELLKRRPSGHAQLLKDAMAALESSRPAGGPARWAGESCEVRRRDGFYPDGRQVGAEYAEQWDGELLRRLSFADVRLGDALNEALAAP